MNVINSDLCFASPIYVTRPLLPDLNSVYHSIEEIWESQWLTNNGPKHIQLENEIKAFLKVPYNCLFNNGTIALITAIQSLRITGEVITTPFTFAATPHVLAWNNINPIFCDIEPNTMCIDSKRIESMITPKTTAILGVHVFGFPCDVYGIQEIADRYGLKVVYDAAHAFGTEINQMGIGNFGDITMFSFHATKLFHSVEGGCLTFNNTHLKNRIDLLKNFGIKNEEEVVMPGINGKMNEIQASIGLQVLKLVENEQIKRKNIKKIYIKELSQIAGIEFPNMTNSNISEFKESYQYFPLRIKKQEFGKSRDEVYLKLKEYNVISRKYFYPLCSEYTCYRQLVSSQKQNLPIAHQIAEEILCLPYYGQLQEQDIQNITEIIKYIQNH